MFPINSVHFNIAFANAYGECIKPRCVTAGEVLAKYFKFHTQIHEFGNDIGGLGKHTAQSTGLSRNYIEVKNWLLKLCCITLGTGWS